MQECHLAVTATLMDLAGTRTGKYSRASQTLSYLSLGSHTYLANRTHVPGTVTIAGLKTCSVQQADVKLLIRANGSEISAQLQQPLPAEKLRQNGVVTAKSKTELFSFVSADSGVLIPANLADDQEVTLIVEARCTAHDTTVQSTPVHVKTLVLCNSARFGTRDPGLGGDGWLRPLVRTVCDRLSAVVPGFSINDVSYMHAGACADHQTHEDGTHVDIRFTGYELQDATTLANLITMFEDEQVGHQIDYVYVTVTSAFAQLLRERISSDCQGITGLPAVNPVTKKCIAEVTSGGRYQVGRVLIKHIGGHSDHFHIHVHPEARQAPVSP